MSTESLVKLAASGNIRGVEEAWLGLLESEVSPHAWQQHAAVLKTLNDKGNAAEAESMATTAIDSLQSKLEGADMLGTASAFLLALKDSDSIRKAVSSLYRELYADTPGLDALIDEAGVEGGRPPRRAVRTMDVCLQLREGMFLSHRHEHHAVRVVSIDPDSWEVEVTDGNDEETYRAVTLADNYAPAPAEDFNVLARFEPERLTKALNDDPGKVILSILRLNGGTMDSDQLKGMLSPQFIKAKDWTRWWTKARQALRLVRQIKLEGRNPYYLTYDPSASGFEDEIEAALKKAHEARQELAIIEEYVRGCPLRDLTVNQDLLARIRDKIEARARQEANRSGCVDLTPWLAARRIAELLDDPTAREHVVTALKMAKDPVDAILAVEDQSFWPAACEALEDSHPDNMMECLLRLLPHAPVAVANHLAEKLVDLGCATEQFVQLAESILREPVRFNEGLLWLWDGPKVAASQPSIPLTTILTRVLNAAGEIKRNDAVSTERTRQIALNTRDVLRARRYARFREALEEMEPGVAAALRTQINRLDNLGRVTDDLDKLIRTKFPQLIITPIVQPKWKEENTVYATREGKDRKHTEMEQLGAKIRENAVAIGRAAELGDLSENSEYKFALEERDLLNARMSQLTKEMDMARLLTAEDVPSDKVGIGCCVVAEHTETGTRHTLTIMGPWEADHERSIYNYRTPLALSILGTPLGETTEVEYLDPPGAYRIVEITSAFS